MADEHLPKGRAPDDDDEGRVTAHDPIVYDNRDVVLGHNVYSRYVQALPRAMGAPEYAGDIAPRRPVSGDPVINRPPIGTYDYPMLKNPDVGGWQNQVDNPPYSQYPVASPGPRYGVPIRSYAQGGYIDEDQVAQLHAGEVVVPADVVASGGSARPVQFPEPPADAGGGGGGGALRQQYDAALARYPETQDQSGRYGPESNYRGRPPSPESFDQYQARMGDQALDPNAPAPAAAPAGPVRRATEGVEADAPDTPSPIADITSTPTAPTRALDDTSPPPNMRTRAEIKNKTPVGQGTARLPPEVAENKPMDVGAPGPQALATGDTKPAPLTPQVKPSMRRYLELEQRDPQLFRDVNEAAVKAGIDPVGYANVLYIESRWNRATPDSSKGAMGLAQVMPDTARDIDPTGRLDPRNDKDNLVLGAMYLRRMGDRYGPGSASSYAAYFAGPGSVDTIYKMSPEDQRKYYPHVLNYAAQVSSDNLAGVARPGAGSVEDRTGGSLSFPNVNATFQARVGAWLNALSPQQRSRISMRGSRTVEEQREIYERHQREGGGPAARPGGSAHNYGLAFDIQGMDEDAQKKLSQFGLAQNVPNDAVHVEPVEIPSGYTNSADARRAAFQRVASGDLKLGDIPGVDVTNAPPPQLAAAVGGAVPASGSGGARPTDGRPVKGDHYNLTAPANIDPLPVIRATAQGGPDAGHEVLMSMVPRGFSTDNAMRALQGALVDLAIHRGQDPDKALEFATIYGQQGAFQHSVKAARALGMGDFQTAADELNTGYNNFVPDGHYSRFVGTAGGVYGERFNPQTGQRVGERFGPLTMADMQRMTQITSIPGTYQKWVHEQQTLAETSRHNQTEEKHQQQVADETARRNRDLAQQESNQARQKADELAQARQKADADRLEKEQEQILKLKEQHDARIKAGEDRATEREIKVIQPAIRDLTSTMKFDGVDATPEQKAAVGSIMNNLLSRDAKTPPDMAFYIAQGLANGTVELGRTQRTQGAPGTRPEFDVNVHRKGEQTVLTYLPRSVLTQAGYWTYDPSKPELVGAPKPIAPPRRPAVFGPPLPTPPGGMPRVAPPMGDPSTPAMPQ